MPLLPLLLPLLLLALLQLGLRLEAGLRPGLPQPMFPLVPLLKHQRVQKRLPCTSQRQR